MTKGPLFILVAVGAVALVILVAVLGLSGGDEGSPGKTGIEGVDLAAIATATYPESTPEVIFVNGLTTSTPDTVVAPGTHQEYTVQPGDTPDSIAAQFGITWQELLAANGIDDPTKLQIGQVLKIPGQTATPTASPGLDGTAAPSGTGVGDQTETPSPTGEMVEYTVVAGGTASALAESDGITPAELAAATNPTVDELRFLNVGQVLKIPGQ